MRFGLDSRSIEYDSDSQDDQDSPVVPLDPPPNRSTRNLPIRSRSTSLKPSTSFVLPSLKHHSSKFPHRSRSILPLSDDSSNSEQDNDDDGDVLGQEDSSDSDDSEEEEWPVGPNASNRSFGIRGLTKGKGKGKEVAFAVGEKSEVEKWNDQTRAQSWANANRTFKLSLSRSMSASPAVLQGRPGTTSSSSVSSIDSLLSRLQLEQSRETQLLVSAFEKRSKSLWESIESSIKLAEEEERAMEENRKRMEEAEKKAREMREQQAKKEEEEKKRRLQEEERLKREREQEREKLEKEKREQEEKDQERDKKMIVVRGKVNGEGSPKGEFEKWSNKMNHIKTTILPLISQNPTLRKACFQAKRSITPKIGQLTSSASAISRIITQLDELLSSIKPTSHEAYVWTLNHLSKSLIKQAETEVTAKLGTAYPLGRVVVGLLLRGHVELGEVLMARLVKKCFWITGYWPSKSPDQSEESYQKLLGHSTHPSHPESLVQYAERMSGLLALYSSILQSSPISPPQSQSQGPSPSSGNAATLSNIPPHFRPSAGWRWLNLMLRPPLVGLEPTPLLVLQFLQIGHKTMEEVFGRQWGKFLEVLLREGVREGKAGFSEKSKSSRVRLELWLEEWEKGEAKDVEGRECDE